MPNVDDRTEDRTSARDIAHEPALLATSLFKVGSLLRQVRFQECMVCNPNDTALAKECIETNMVP